jgi:acetyl-CoA carboxylase carboxyltransferase component
MCGKSYDPRLIFAWHTAQIAVMSGKSAANTLLQIQVSAAEAKGKELTSEEKNALLAKIEQTYNETLSPYYAAARLWVDGVIDPRATRHIISVGIEAANQNHEVPRFNPGVIQV